MPMQAVIRTGGKQAIIAEGDIVDVELLAVKPGDEVKFDDVLMIVDGKDSKIGAPRVEGASVTAKVVREVKGEKVRAVFFRRRKDSMTTKGHRQQYHRIAITGIDAG